MTKSVICLTSNELAVDPLDIVRVGPVSHQLPGYNGRREKQASCQADTQGKGA